MTNEQKLVRDWMQKFGQDCPEKPGIPDVGVRILRAKLILEEALEVVEALGFVIYTVDTEDEVNKNNISLYATGFPNLEAIAKECADLEVVTIGTEVACGIDGEHTLKEVMRSNDSKLWTSTEVEVALTKGLECIKVKEFTGFRQAWSSQRNWLVKDKDGKVIKSPSYSPANLKPLLSPAQAE